MRRHSSGVAAVLLSLAAIVSCGESDKAAQLRLAAEGKQRADKIEQELKQSEKETQLRLAAEEKQRVDKIEQELKQTVTRKLIDPMSAQFRDLRVLKRPKTGDPVLCGEVNAKNRMGGYVGFRPFVAAKDDALICSLVPEQRSTDAIFRAAECNRRLREVGCIPGGPWTDEESIDFQMRHITGR